MSFQQGLSGLNAASRNLDVIGNNIANAATVGFKGSRAEFADMYANAMNGAGAGQVGIGVTVAKVAQQFTQGNISITDNPLDIAINGGGFFQVADFDRSTGSVTGELLYSRNGQFKIDQAGYIVNNQGKALMGASGPIQVPNAGLPAQATSSVSMEVNLDARAEPPTATFDPNDASSYNNATSVTTYDPLGVPSSVTFYFRKTADNQWEIHATKDGVAADAQPVATVDFDPATGLPTADLSALALPNASATPAATYTLDMSRTVQFGSAVAVTDLDQDGPAPGALVGVTPEADGRVMVRYSNGETREIGRIPLYTFQNPNGLEPLGNNVWRATDQAGTPRPNAPGSGGVGVLQRGAIEESNVDLTAELVAMITAQRNYQANAQTIKTQDQVMQTLVNMR
jgi:flagellar hook protein FlgE